jgi:hypothetical protein
MGYSKSAVYGNEFCCNWCKNHFISDFQKIKDPYLPKAKEFGLVL